MSRLIDKLTKATRATSQPMGFRTARADREEPKMLVIADVKLDNTNQIGDYVAGADAVLLHCGKASLSAKVIQPVIESIPDIPCGVSLEDTGTDNAKALIKAGCDFLVFTDTSPIEAVPVEDEDIGKVMQVEPSLEDSMIRVINNLPVDAILASDSYKANTPLAWHDLMSLQRLGLLLTKPLLVPVSPGISPSELKAIWEADVDGVVIEADPGKSDLFKGIRKNISELPPRTAIKHGKSEALLPYTGSAQQTSPPDEEEEEYE
jgi:hypothetical protein